MKKVIAMAIAAALAVTAAGCSAASTARQQASWDADNFEVVRELTVFDNCTGQVLLMAEGCMSIEAVPDYNQLRIIVKQPGGKYEQHFVGLNETTTYIVTDVEGVDVDSFRYKLTINPDMLIPFEPGLVTGGDQ